MKRNPENLVRIRQALTWVFSKPDGVVANHSDEVENLIVVKEGDKVFLHFIDTKTLLIKTKISDIMSSIDISEPLKLTGKYAQAMMQTLSFVAEPQKIYMLGFGGGRVPMIFHHHFPHVSIDASEVSEGVLHLAQSCFGITLDDRIKVSVKDGRKHLTCFPEKHFDIILLDSFSGLGEHPNQLSTIEFYELCKSRLTKGGVVATNLVNNNPYFHRKVATFCAAFNYSYQYESEGIYIFFGSDTDDFSKEDFSVRAEAIAGKNSFEFPYRDNSDCISRCTADMFSSKLLYDDTTYDDDEVNQEVA